MKDDKFSNDARRLRLVVAEHGRMVESFLAHVERDPALREELWADVIGLVYQHIDELEPLSAAQVRSWLLRTARYLTANAARRAQTRRRVVERLAREPLEFVVSAEDEFIDSDVTDEGLDRSHRIRAALNQLHYDYQQILIMNALGQTGPKIAEELGISHQAARSRLMRARSAFFIAFTASQGVGHPDAGTESI